MKKELEILYEDTDILVCVKPAGIASETRKAGCQDMVSLLRNYRNRKGEEPYIGLVHRLDQPVEGILVFGKHSKSTAALSRQLAHGSFCKIYLAVAEGIMPAQKGRLQNYLKKDGRSNCSFVTSADDPQGKSAELLYQVEAVDDEHELVRNLVRIQLATGRHHQIRVQFAHLGTPLAGDRKYGGTEKKPENWKAGSENGLGLCACELHFEHPVTKQNMYFKITPSQAVFQQFYSRKWQGTT